MELLKNTVKWLQAKFKELCNSPWYCAPKSFLRRILVIRNNFPSFYKFAVYYTCCLFREKYYCSNLTSVKSNSFFTLTEDQFTKLLKFESLHWTEIPAHSMKETKRIHLNQYKIVLHDGKHWYYWRSWCGGTFGILVPALQCNLLPPSLRHNYSFTLKMEVANFSQNLVTGHPWFVSGERLSWVVRINIYLACGLDMNKGK